MEIIEFSWLTLYFHLDLRSSLINQIYGFIRKETVCKVSVGKHGSSNKCFILNTHAMV